MPAAVAVTPPNVTVGKFVAPFGSMVRKLAPAPLVNPASVSFRATAGLAFQTTPLP